MREWSSMSIQDYRNIAQMDIMNSCQIKVAAPHIWKLPEKLMDGTVWTIVSIQYKIWLVAIFALIWRMKTLNQNTYGLIY